MIRWFKKRRVKLYHSRITVRYETNVSYFFSYQGATRGSEFILSVLILFFFSVVQTDIVLPQLILQRASFRVCFLLFLLLKKNCMYTLIFITDMRLSIVIL